MTTSGYKRFARFITRNYANVAATLALVIALTGATAVAAGVIVTSKQIKNGTILSQDIHNNDIKSTDIENGEVKPRDVTMPEPEEVIEKGATGFTPTLQFQKLDVVGTYTKEAAESTLEVDWTGSVLGKNGGEASGCVFQLRVDGAPSSTGGGEVFGQGLTSVSASALFDGLGTGPHTIEVWARMVIDTPAGDNCVVGPAEAGTSQSFLISEQVF